ADGHLVTANWPIPRSATAMKMPRTVEVKRWDMETQRAVQSFSAAVLMYLHPIPSGDGRRLAVAGQDTITIIDVRSGETIAMVDHPGKNPVQWLALSDDGRMLAWSPDGKAVRVWDTVTAAPACRPLAAQDPAFLVFSPDGNRLAVG